MMRFGLGGAFAFGLVLTMQAHPDFTGRWEMEASRSDFAGGAAPTRRVDTIVQRDSVLVIVRLVVVPNGGPQLHHYDLAIDGHEHRNRVGSLEIRSTLHWEGDELVVESAQPGPVGDVTATDRWRLSSNRDTLTVQRNFVAGGSAVAQRLVFVRRGGGG